MLRRSLVVDRDLLLIATSECNDRELIDDLPVVVVVVVDGSDRVSADDGDE